MKLIRAVIRPERLAAVKEALFRAGVTGMTLSRVSGHGGEREVVEQYRGSSARARVPRQGADRDGVLRAVRGADDRGDLSAARTGEVGDGKIFVQPLEQVIRIRTGETDSDALTPVTADEVQSARSGHAGSGRMSADARYLRRRYGMGARLDRARAC